jgi:ribonuclease HII
MAFLALKKLVPEGIGEDEVCGLDEVGRGPWAGPIVACAMMLPSALRLPGLKDSKHLTAERREEFFKVLEQKAAYGTGMASVEEIDRMGLLKANNLAFTRALEQLAERGRVPKFVLVDGRDRMTLPHPWKTLIKGDEKVKLIACASIMAKVIRDRIMEDLAAAYPEYGFDDHKGYGTKSHQEALKTHGASPVHRKSFAPVHNLLQMTIE